MKSIEYEKIISEDVRKMIINDYVNNLLSMKDLVIKYKIFSKTFIRKVLGDKIRSISEATKIAHKRYPSRFIHSDESKQKMREHRLKFMKEHPEKTAWRMKNISYPEKCFKNMLINKGLDKLYLIHREYSVFPYFIDFAFVDIKVAVEIDGSQHLLKERKEKDKLKDETLLNEGWKVLRFTAKDVISNIEFVYDNLLLFLDDSDVEYETVGVLTKPKTRVRPKSEKPKLYKKVGILKEPKIYKKVDRDENGFSSKMVESALRQRKAIRPSKEELLEMIKKYSFVELGRKYGVSDNAIRNWCKKYSIPFRKQDIILPKDKPKCSECGKVLNQEPKSGLCRECLLKKEPTKEVLIEMIEKYHNRYIIAEKLGYTEGNIRRLAKKFNLTIK